MSNTTLSPRLPDMLAQVAALPRRWYPHHRFVLVGYSPDGDAAAEIRIPCPESVLDSDEPAPPEGPGGLDSLVSLIRRQVPAAIKDADHVLLMVAHRDGKEPTQLSIHL